MAAIPHPATNAHAQVRSRTVRLIWRLGRRLGRRMRVDSAPAWDMPRVAHLVEDAQADCPRWVDVWMEKAGREAALRHASAWFDFMSGRHRHRHAWAASA
eukprot:353522-Chlamydomonas_euryale.AAC.19